MSTKAASFTYADDRLFEQTRSVQHINKSRKSRSPREIREQTDFVHYGNGIPVIHTAKGKWHLRVPADDIGWVADLLIEKGYVQSGFSMTERKFDFSS